MKFLEKSKMSLMTDLKRTTGNVTQIRRKPFVHRTNIPFSDPTKLLPRMGELRFYGVRTNKNELLKKYRALKWSK